MFTSSSHPSSACAGLTRLAVLGALFVVAATGCERSPAGTVPDRSTAVGANAASSSEDATSARCESIEDCESYLSCIDKRCQEPPAVTGQREPDTPVVSFRDERGQTVAKFFVELALTPAEQKKGLMYRREMKDDWGMLFIYPDEGARSFWMQNTFISLDMIFIDARGRIVNIIDEVEPLTRTRRTSQGDARFVLELEAGRAAEAGLAPGQQMTLENVDPAHRPTSPRDP